MAILKPDRSSAISAMRHEIELIGSEGDGDQIFPAGWAKLRNLRILDVGDQRPARSEATCQALQAFRTIAAIPGAEAMPAASGKHGNLALIEGQPFTADRFERELANYQLGPRMRQKRPAAVRVCRRCACQSPAADRNPVAAR